MENSRTERYQRYRRYFVNLGQLYQKKKVRVYTGIVLSLLTTAFFLFFAIRPTLTTIASLVKEIKDKKSITEQLDDKIKSLNAAQVEYQKIEQELFLVDSALPTHAHVSLLVPQLEALARENNVTLQAIQINATMLRGQEEKEETKTKDSDSKVQEERVGFNLTVMGDYKNLRAFISSLIDLRRTTSIKAFAFSLDQEDGLSLTLNARAHYLSQPEAEE